eukprot:gene14377-15875_t
MDNERDYLLKRAKKRKFQAEDSFELSSTSTKEQQSEDVEDPTEDFTRSISEFKTPVPRRSWTTLLILILTPLLLCPLPITQKNQESKAAYGILIMIVYWVTEVTPLAVTSTLPLFIFPLLGVLTATEVAAAYLQDANVLFLGGLLVFVAFEECNLHKRIAMKTLLMLGTKKPNLVFGFMITTASISMLLSNTATAAMMVQIVKVILTELEKTDVSSLREEEADDHSESCYNDHTEVDITPAPTRTQENHIQNTPKITKQKASKETEGFAKVLLLAVAFSANIGGFATLTGTGTNMIFAGQAKKLFPGSGGVSFSSWFGFAFPLMVVLLVISWAFLVLVFLGFRSFFTCFKRDKGDESKAIREVIKIEYQSLGKISFAEVAVLLHIVILVILWLTKEPQFMPGWSVLFRDNYVSDGTVAMLIVFLLFQCPSEKPNILCWKRRKGSSLSKKPILDLKTVSDKLCWDVLVLLGSGFAIAAACEKSGLSASISHKLASLSSIPDYAMIAIACITVTAMTEILSNTGTATIFLPVLASLATSTHIHPWKLMIPATISCSFAFMFPISTPPNAIVYSAGRLKMFDMVKAGFGMDIICVLVLLLFVNTYGSYYYKWSSYPSWAGASILHPTMFVNTTTPL